MSLVIPNSNVSGDVSKPAKSAGPVRTFLRENYAKLMVGGLVAPALGLALSAFAPVSTVQAQNRHHGGWVRSKETANISDDSLFRYYVLQPMRQVAHLPDSSADLQIIEGMLSLSDSASALSKSILQNPKSPLAKTIEGYIRNGSVESAQAAFDFSPNVLKFRLLSSICRSDFLEDAFQPQDSSSIDLFDESAAPLKVKIKDLQERAHATDLRNRLGTQFFLLGRQIVLEAQKSIDSVSIAQSAELAKRENFPEQLEIASQCFQFAKRLNPKLAGQIKSFSGLIPTLQSPLDAKLNALDLRSQPLVDLATVLYWWYHDSKQMDSGYVFRSEFFSHLFDKPQYYDSAKMRVELRDAASQRAQASRSSRKLLDSVAKMGSYRSADLLRMLKPPHIDTAKVRADMRFVASQKTDQALSSCLKLLDSAAKMDPRKSAEIFSLGRQMLNDGEVHRFDGTDPSEKFFMLAISHDPSYAIQAIDCYREIAVVIYNTHAHTRDLLDLVQRGLDVAEKYHVIADQYFPNYGYTITVESAFRGDTTIINEFKK